MEKEPGVINDLPLRGSLSRVIALSILVTILMIFASLVGFLFPSLTYPDDALVRSFVPNDLVNLLIGLPVLLVSMQFARKGKLVGLLLLPGALFYVFYNYAAYVIAMPPNWVYPVHLVLAFLSILALISLIGKLDAERIRVILQGSVNERIAGGILMALGLLFSLRALVIILAALFNGSILPRTDLAVNVVDVLVTPAWVISGISIWRHKSFGYATGLGVLFQGSMLFIALMVFLLVQPFLTHVPFPVVDFLVITGMGMICFVPFALFLRGVIRRSHNSSVRNG